jgi:hypothetical protein
VGGHECVHRILGSQSPGGTWPAELPSALLSHMFSFLCLLLQAYTFFFSLGGSLREVQPDSPTPQLHVGTQGDFPSRG